MSDDGRNTSSTRSAIVSLPDKRLFYAIGDIIYTFVLTGADTAGAYTFLDGFIPPGGRQMPHCHGHEKMLFVIEGELEVFYDQSRVTLRPSAGINIPSWMPHMLWNNGELPVRVFVTVLPAGLEELFSEIGQQVASRTSLPPALSEDEREKLGKLLLPSFRRHHVRLLPDDMFDHLLSDPAHEQS